MSLSQEQMNKLRELHDKRLGRERAFSQEQSTTQQASTTNPVTATETQTEERGGSAFGNFLGGALYGVSAPGRTIQKGLSKGVDALFGTSGFGEATQEGFEQSTGTDLDITAGRVGSVVGEAATFVAPGGIASRLTTKAPWMVKALAQGAASFGQQSLNEGEINRSSFAAGATDAALPIAGKVLGLGGDILKGLTGGLTGQGVDVIDTALSRPSAAFSVAGSDATSALGDLSSQVRVGVRALDDKAGKEYARLVSEAGVDQLPRKFVKDGITERMAKLADATVDAGGLKFVDTPFTDAEEKLLTKVYNNIVNWEDYSPAGLNNLARKISRFRRGSQDSANFDRVIDVTKRELRDFVGKVGPSIAEANRRFSDKMDLIDEIDNVLKTGTQYQGREGIRKTAENLGRVFSSGKEFTREAIQEVEQELGVDILGKVAGLRLSDTAPRAASSIGDTLGNVVRPFASVTARNAVPAAGAVNLIVDRVMSIPGVPESARGAVVSAVANMMEEEDNTIPQTKQ